MNLYIFYMFFHIFKMLRRKRVWQYILRKFRRKPKIITPIKMPSIDLREIPFPIAAQLPLEIQLQAFSDTPSNNGSSLYHELKNSLPEDRIFPGEKRTGTVISVEYRERILRKYCMGT